MINPQESKQCPLCKEDLVVDLLYTDSDFNVVGKRKGIKISTDLGVYPSEYSNNRQFIDGHAYCPQHLMIFNIEIEMDKL